MPRVDCAELHLDISGFSFVDCASQLCQYAQEINLNSP